MRQKSTRLPLGNPPSTTPERKHQSVLAQEVMDALEPRPDGTYVDATFGDGGHSRAILQRLGPQGRLLALDRDQKAIQRGVEWMHDYPGQLILVHTPFSRLKEVLIQHSISAVQGVLFDLGVSSRQLDEPGRGFSFQTDGPLDMRMDQAVVHVSEKQSSSGFSVVYKKTIAGVRGPSRPPAGVGGAHGLLPEGHPVRKPKTAPITASTIVNTFGKEALADIFFRFGEERHARRIAQAIVTDRQQRPFTTTRQLATLMERITPRNAANKRKKAGAIHPATRIFQALRIAVNGELEELKTGLDTALACLASHGKVAVISFHSLEDRIVKQTFRQAAEPVTPPLGPAALVQPSETIPLFRILTRKPLLPGIEETQQNPRARSARMRVIERLMPDKSEASP